MKPCSRTLGCTLQDGHPGSCLLTHVKTTITTKSDLERRVEKLEQQIAALADKLDDRCPEYPDG